MSVVVCKHNEITAFPILIALYLVACQGTFPDREPCDGVTCSNHGTCWDDGRNAECRCNSGFHPEGLDCVANSADGDADSDADVDSDADSDSDADGDADWETDVPGDADVERCEYPAGPYELALGGTVGPMRWSAAVAGSDTLGEPDLAALFCDSDVHSVFVQLASVVDPSSPSRVRSIGELREHWETHGARWIFLVVDAPSSTEASEYVDRLGVTFGWRSNDADNTMEPYAIVDSPLFEGIPWTAVIRTSDMQLVYEEPDDRYLDLESIAIELASGE